MRRELPQGGPIIVSQRDYHLIERMLENPPGPNAALRKAAERYKKEVKDAEEEEEGRSPGHD